jgi:release factor glutamine methyltransferase
MTSTATRNLTVGAALNTATALLADAGIDIPRTDAVKIAMFALNCSREDIVREPERTFSPREELIFDKAIALRVLRRPLAYITGKQWFYGLEFKVNRAVLIPRPETEMLVEFALEQLPMISSEPLIADIGTGSGCIAVSIAKNAPETRIVAVDVSEMALRLAKKNAEGHSVQWRVKLFQGDLLEPLRDYKFDLIVSNPPYIADADISGLMPEVGQYEPALALYAGAGDDGTGLHRQLIDGSRALLKNGGWLAMEVGLGQANAVCSFAIECGYKPVEVRQDLAGIDRIVVAQWNSGEVD